MHILLDYDTDRCIERVWYESSNIVYSLCEDKLDDYKEVTIVFKNGSTYQYHKVNVNDYLLFRSSISSGKGLNKYLKKYEYTKLDNTDIELIINQYNETLSKKNN